MRTLKAMELASRALIVFRDGFWIVPSQCSPGTCYRVTIEPPSCECEDFALRREACKHVMAARLVNERQGGTAAPVIDTDTPPKRKTYRQNWKVYRQAQHEEKERIMILLHDLCSGVVDPPHNKRGTRPIPRRDRLFTVCYKVWSTLSSSRWDTDLRDAVKAKLLSRKLHSNKVNCFMEEADLTPYLKAMVVRSSLPLRPIETQFAVDSTGFSTSRFVRWYDKKYGVVKQEHDWVKVHVAVGVNTHIVTAAAIYGRDANDCPVLPELVQQTGQNFKVEEVSADKAYLSVENVEAIFNEGGLPFIAPKSNTTGAAGGLFEKMVGWYQYRKEDFLTHYHKRSNVESNFSAVKRKLGDSVRSRTPVAMVNEVLCKLICNNLWCVILGQLESGIVPEFWPTLPTDEGQKPQDGNQQPETEERPALLPFVRIG